nr:MAG TPA: hypothetical protein [Caudoviricetes sp.]
MFQLCSRHKCREQQVSNSKNVGTARLKKVWISNSKQQVSNNNKSPS